MLQPAGGNAEDIVFFHLPICGIQNGSACARHSTFIAAQDYTWPGAFAMPIET
jgi:hypothetical protein